MAESKKREISVFCGLCGERIFFNNYAKTLFVRSWALCAH